MGSGNITEVVRDLENELQEKKIVLKYYQKNIENKREVDRIINNERMNLKCQESPSGNAWANADNLRQNIEKVNKEIGLYEDIHKPKLKFR